MVAASLKETYSPALSYAEVCLLWACNTYAVGVESMGCGATRQKGLPGQASLEIGYCSGTNVAGLSHYRGAKVRYYFSLSAPGATSSREASLRQGGTLLRSQLQRRRRLVPFL